MADCAQTVLAPMSIATASNFLDNLATPRLSLNVNTLMLVNIAGYVREVLQSIREALEQQQQQQ